MKALRNLLAGLSLLIAAATPAAAQFQIGWHTIDGGGGFCAGGAFELAGTPGQPDAGVLTGGSFELTGGYWALAAPVPCPGDADLDGDIDLSDLALVLSQFGQSGAGLAGDVDADGDVDLSDLALVLANFGQTC